VSLEAVQDRIREIESAHKVEGGTHFDGGFCPTCKTIEKLEGLKKQLLKVKPQNVFKNDKIQTEELIN